MVGWFAVFTRNPPKADKTIYAIRRTQDEKMAGRIIINIERCKGCGLCVAVCPKSGIAISKKSNKSSYFPAQPSNTDCTGCAVCAIVCPDVAIEVFRENKVASAKSARLRSPKSNKKGKPNLIKEKA
jgi:2-oxoglutarate ferredoxin oxidoreductase subunit delta